MFSPRVNTLARLGGIGLVAMMQNQLGVSRCDGAVQTVGRAAIRKTIEPEALEFDNAQIEFAKAKMTVGRIEESYGKIAEQYLDYNAMHDLSEKNPLDVDLKKAEEHFSALDHSIQQLLPFVIVDSKAVAGTSHHAKCTQVMVHCLEMQQKIKEMREKILHRVSIAHLESYQNQLTNLKKQWDAALALQDPETAERSAQVYLASVREELMKLPVIQQEQKERKFPNPEEITGVLKDISALKQKAENEITEEDKKKALQLDKTLIAWCCEHIEMAKEVDAFMESIISPKAQEVGLMKQDCDALAQVLKYKLKQASQNDESVFAKLHILDEAVAKMDVRSLLEGKITNEQIQAMAKMCHATNYRPEICLEYLEGLVMKEVRNGFSIAQLQLNMDLILSKIDKMFSVAFENAGSLILGKDDTEKASKKVGQDARVGFALDVYLEAASMREELERYSNEEKDKQVFNEIEKLRKELHTTAVEYTQNALQNDGKCDPKLLNKLRAAHGALQTKALTEGVEVFRRTADEKTKEYRSKVIRKSGELLSDVGPRWKQDVINTNQTLATQLGLTAGQTTQKVLSMNEAVKDAENKGGWTGGFITAGKWTVLGAVGAGVFYVAAQVLGKK
jgi:hypothetical protein